MKKNILTALFLLFITLGFAQTKTTYWVVFKDKKNSPYSLQEPKAYLSERAIARRERQHIEINSRDLPVNPAYVNAVSSLGAVVKNRSKWFNGITVTLANQQNLSAIEALPFVKSVQKIIAIPSESADDKFENEMAEAEQSQRGYVYGPSFSQAKMIGADCMHEWGYKGQGMQIAVLDAGFYFVNALPAFDSIRINRQILGCRDMVTGDTMVYEDYSHGMNVLSCMAGNIRGQIVGTAPLAKYWLIRTEDAGSESLQEEINWLVGAEFADSAGADIINSSLGYNRFDDASTNHTYADMDGNTTIVTRAADWAAATGIFVVSSAGNSGGPTWYKITAPADADSVLTVGAVDSTGAIAGFSSRGPTSDGRIKPNIVAQGVHAAVQSNNGTLAFYNGTSFSGPIAAGAVACLWQANPGMTNMELLGAIEQSGSQRMSPDTIKGYGIPNFCFANTILAGIGKYEAHDESLSVYPNPFSNTFEINFYSTVIQSVKVELYDISGRKISSMLKTMEMNTGNRFSISEATHLSPGMYILQIHTSKGTYTKKLVRE
ncbi:MAG: serine protease [Bacteroidota bacterium]|nr:serine protease [Bacteroidota bacterium]